MATITLADAQIHLKELIEQSPGQELVIEDGGRTVARLIVEKKSERKPRTPGTLKGTVLWMDPNFNAPIEDFKEYM